MILNVLVFLFFSSVTYSLTMCKTLLCFICLLTLTKTSNFFWCYIKRRLLLLLLFVALNKTSKRPFRLFPTISHFFFLWSPHILTFLFFLFYSFFTSYYKWVLCSEQESLSIYPWDYRDHYKIKISTTTGFNKKYVIYIDLHIHTSYKKIKYFNLLKNEHHSK